jgi:hypothetical protein
MDRVEHSQAHGGTARAPEGVVQPSQAFEGIARLGAVLQKKLRPHGHFMRFRTMTEHIHNPGQQLAAMGGHDHGIPALTVADLRSY